MHCGSLGFNLYQGLWCFETTSAALGIVAIVTMATAKIKWYLDQIILKEISFLSQPGQRQLLKPIHAPGEELIWEPRLPKKQENFLPLPLSHTLWHWFQRRLRMKITMRHCVLLMKLARLKCLIKCQKSGTETDIAGGIEIDIIFWESNVVVSITIYNAHAIWLCKFISSFFFNTCKMTYVQG